MSEPCPTCGRPHSSPSDATENDPEHLLARFFFALMGEVMQGPVTPELIDDINRLRESWQRDLETVRGRAALDRERLRARPRVRVEPGPRAKVRPPAPEPVLPPSVVAALTVLGLSRSANIDDVRRAFRALALRFHPDKNPGDVAAEERFKKVNQAYRIASTALTLRRAV